MARKPGARTRKKKSGRLFVWLSRFAAASLLVAMAFAAWLCFDMRNWRPSEELYPEQGAVISSGASATRFETIKALGGDFVYLSLAPAGAVPDPGFGPRVSAARAATLKVGVLQPFDPCLRADEQSARYTRTVPRDADLLPPAIHLDQLANGCNPDVSDAAVESELLTFVNQIEMHTGRPVILKITRAFQDRHKIAATLARDLWLERDRARPDYAGRPWLLWSANGGLVTAASEESIEWVVVQK